jgi:Putative RNA methylase family UPF0020
VRYFIQHVAGTGDLVEAGLLSLLTGMDVVYRDDSSMMFASASVPAAVAQVPFVKNAFVVLMATPRGNIDKGVQQLSRLLTGQPTVPFLPRAKAFRTMVHLDGSLAAVSQASRAALERAVAARTGGRPEPRGMCQEYWVIGRDALGEFLLCARLPKSRTAPKLKGSLSPELSSMLVFASRPRPDDVFLDPFAGTGSLVLARLGSQSSRVVYSDTQLRQFRPDFPAELKASKAVTFLAEDALTLAAVHDGEIDAIVTDPPWGEHEDLGVPYEEFADAMAQSFRRVLHPSRGRCVALINRRNAKVFARALDGVSLNVTAEYGILVNGHPATVLVSHPR